MDGGSLTNLITAGGLLTVLCPRQVTDGRDVIPNSDLLCFAVLDGPLYR